MSKGGGSTNNTVTQTQTPNPLAQAQYQTALGVGNAVAGQNYPVYNSPLVAGFNPTQTAAFNNINSAAGIAQPYIGEAANLIQASTSGVNPATTVDQFSNPALQGYLNSAQALTSQGGAGVNQGTASQLLNPALQGYLNPAQSLTQQGGQGINPLSGQFGVQSFMNPYTQNVTSSLQGLMNQQDAQQQTQLVGQAAGAGAFGGDRAQIAQSVLSGQQDLANSATLANVLQSGYGQALGAAQQTGTTNAQLALGAGSQLGQLGGIEQGAYQSALGTGLSNAQLALGAGSQMGNIGNIGQAAYQSALGTGLSSQEANAWLASQGAFGMANLGQEAQGEATSGANSMLQAGGLEQQLAQEQLSVPYGQFQSAQAFPYQISNMELGLATGALGAGSSASTTYPPPSLTSQLAGLGTAGLGVASLYNSGAFSGLNPFGSSTDPYLSGGVPVSSTSGDLPFGTDPSLTGSTGVPWTDVLGARGGRIPHRALGGALHYDDGGALPLSLGPPAGGISPVTQSGLGSGNPMYGGALNQLSGLPTEKLQELQARIPPGSPQGGLVQAVLRRRQMMPQSDPSMALQAPQTAAPQSPMQGLGGLPGMPGMASGGDVGDDNDILVPETPFPIMPNDLTYQRAPLVGPVATRPDIPGLGSSQSLGAPASLPTPAGLSAPDQTDADAAASDAARKNTGERPVGLSAPARSYAPQMPQPAALGNLTGQPQGYLDITGQAENSGRIHGGGPMTSSGEARGLYQITDGTWRDFAPKAGVDLSKYPNADAADRDTQTAVANIIPIQRWDPRTVAKLQAAYPDMDPTKPLGSLAGAEAADLDARGAQGRPTTVAEDTSEELPSPQHGRGEGSTALGGNDWMSSPGAALLAAGLGIMGGSSPFASVNIGKGALEGLKFAQQAHGQDAQIAETQARIAQTGDYQKGELALRALGLSQQAATEKATQAYRQAVLDQGRYTNTPWQQPDPNDPSKIITGIMRTSVRGDEPPQFTPTQGVPVNKADPSAAMFNAQGAAASDVHGDDYLKTLPANIGTQVKALADGRMPFPTGFALKSPYWQNMLSAVSTYDPTFDAINYNSRNKTRSDFTSGQSAKTITALNTVMPHLEVLDKSFDALNNGQFPWLNAASNWMAEKGLEGKDASAAPTNAREAVSAVASEMRKVFQSSGGGGLAELEQWEKNFPLNGTPEQQKGAIKQAISLMDSRLSALGDTYYRGMGKTEEPTNFLSPTAQATYQKLTGHVPQSAAVVRNQTPGSTTGATQGTPNQPASPAAAGPPAAAVDFLRTHARNSDGSENSDLLYQFKQKYGADPAQYLTP